MHRMETKDLYAELGLPRSCSQEDIKKAYKKLALVIRQFLIFHNISSASQQWHPDKNQDRIEESTKKFQKISEAYASRTTMNPIRSFNILKFSIE